MDFTLTNKEDYFVLSVIIKVGDEDEIYTDGDNKVYAYITLCMCCRLGHMYKYLDTHTHIDLQHVMPFCLELLLY